MILYFNKAKYTAAERTIVKSIVANLSLKRIPEPEIMSQSTDIATRHYHRPIDKAASQLSIGPNCLSESKVRVIYDL